jgi:hypothetical protein
MIYVLDLIETKNKYVALFWPCGDVILGIYMLVPMYCGFAVLLNIKNRTFFLNIFIEVTKLQTLLT